MTTAPARGTRAWRQLRDTWQQRINANGGWTCRRCGRQIPPHQRSAWQLGHPDDMTVAATDIRDLEPEHAHENMSAGATAGNHARAGTGHPQWAL